MQPKPVHIPRIREWFGALVALIMFAGALWVLHHELRYVHYHELLDEVRHISARRIAMALGLTVLSYLTLTGYDSLGFAYLGRRLAYHRIGLGSFLGYALSHNLGFAALTGPAIRFRIYSAWGLTLFEVTKLFAFCGAMFWLGFLALSGAAFLVEPLSLPDDFHLSLIPLRIFGIVLLAILAAYLLWIGLKKHELRFRSWTFPAPSLRLSLLGIALSCLDWTLAAGVLYVLFSWASEPRFTAFLSMFMLAQLLAFITHVPGGLGVFETLMLLFLKADMPTSQILGTLLIYRCLYYLLPLGVAVLLLAGHELLRRRGPKGRHESEFDHQPL